MRNRRATLILAILAWAFTGPGGAAHPSQATGQPQGQRASACDGPMAGVFSYYSFQKRLERWPEARTQLTYVDLDGPLKRHLPQLEKLVTAMRAQPGQVLQLGIHTRRHALGPLVRDLRNPKAPLSRALDDILDIVDRAGFCVILRPLSEMNSGSEGSPWELNWMKDGVMPNRPEDFIDAWRLIAHRVKSRRNPALQLMFSPLANRQQYSVQAVRQILLGIPPGQIDWFAPTIYARPGTWFGDKNRDYDSPAELVRPWVGVVRSTHHARRVRLGVAELGFSAAGDRTLQVRAWLRAARELKAAGFEYLLYFQAGNFLPGAAAREWGLPWDASSQRRLSEGLAEFQAR